MYPEAMDEWILLQEALDCAPREREIFLRFACGKDEALCRRIEERARTIELALEREYLSGSGLPQPGREPTPAPPERDTPSAPPSPSPDRSPSP